MFNKEQIIKAAMDNYGASEVERSMFERDILFFIDDTMKKISELDKELVFDSLTIEYVGDREEPEGDEIYVLDLLDEVVFKTYSWILNDTSFKNLSTYIYTLRFRIKTEVLS